MSAWVQASRTEKIIAVLVVLLSALQPAIAAIELRSVGLGLVLWLPQIALILSMLLFQPRLANITGAAIAASVHFYIFSALFLAADDGLGMLTAAFGYYYLHVGIASGAWFSVAICRKHNLNKAWACVGVTVVSAFIGSLALVLVPFTLSYVA